MRSSAQAPSPVPQSSRVGRCPTRRGELPRRVLAALRPGCPDRTQTATRHRAFEWSAVTQGESRAASGAVVDESRARLLFAHRVRVCSPPPNPLAQGGRRRPSGSAQTQREPHSVTHKCSFSSKVHSPSAPSSPSSVSAGLNARESEPGVTHRARITEGAQRASRPQPTRRSLAHS